MIPWIFSLLLTLPLLAEEGFSPLFNGKNLDRWEVDAPGLWQAQDGMIIGKSPGLSYSDFLRTRRTFSDFVLKVSFRLIDGKGNSGIQVRSKAVPASHEVMGYQVDIAEGWWANLYDEARRRKFLAEAPPAAVASILKDGWNEYVITARGNHVTMEVNGVPAIDYEELDPTIPASGIVALQLHSGLPLEVHFKDIQIRELTR